MAKDEEILEDVEKNSDENENMIASIIKVVAWIELVFGIIFSFLNSKSYDGFDSNALILNIIIFGGAFIGIYALGEIIEILHDIRYELRKKNK